MRILILTPSLPFPPEQGGALRNFGIIRALAQQGHDVTLLSFGDPAAGNSSSPLQQLCVNVRVISPPERSRTQRVIDLIVTQSADIARRLESPAMREALRQLLKTQRFDLVQFEGLEMAIYANQVQDEQPNAALVYDAHNAEHALQRAIAAVRSEGLKGLIGSAYSTVQAHRIKAFESSIVQKMKGVIAVSDDDARLLSEFRPRLSVKVLPNGIDVDAYASVEDTHLDLGDHSLVFTGKMDYRPNTDAVIWFAREILPLIRRAVPDVRLVIVGQKPSAPVQALTSDTAIKVTGWVERVQPYLKAARVYIAPLRMGSGTRLKLLEALAAGCAVVATSAAAAGLDEALQPNLIIADDGSDFADATVRLLNDERFRRSIGSSAQETIRRLYDWSVLGPQLERIYEDVLRG